VNVSVFYNYTKETSHICVVNMLSLVITYDTKFSYCIDGMIHMKIEVSRKNEKNPSFRVDERSTNK
jgi:hypothetical protein